MEIIKDGETDNGQVIKHTLGSDKHKGEKQISNAGENVSWAILDQGSPF